MQTTYCDISMSRAGSPRPDTNALFGALIDYDSADPMSTNNDSYPATNSIHKQRTGTRLFMSIDLLNGEDKHYRVRHDIESLFWVIAWCAFRFDRQNDEIGFIESVGEDSRLSSWLAGSAIDIEDKKSAFLARPFTTNIKAHFRSMTRPWLIPFRDLLVAACDKRTEFSETVFETTGEDSLQNTSEDILEAVVDDVKTTFNLETLEGNFTYKQVGAILYECGEERLEEKCSSSRV